MPVEQHIAALAAGPYQVVVLPVKALPGEPEAYEPDQGPMRLLVAESDAGRGVAADEQRRASGW